MGVDPFMLAAFTFTLLVILLIGGFVIAFPVTRRLGALLEEWVEERRRARLGTGDAEELRRRLDDVRERLERLDEHVELLSERQRFTESLLEGPEPGKGATGEGSDDGPAAGGSGPRKGERPDQRSPGGSSPAG
jgi:hypothetical protein